MPVEADKWAHPPFGAEIHDGFIYGRGARDMKDTVAIELMVYEFWSRGPRRPAFATCAGVPLQVS